MTGAPLFASANAQMGLEQNRQDDIEALGYMAAYLLRGNLPWQECAPQSWKTLTAKLCTSAGELFRGYPGVFAEILIHACQLSFDDMPNYQMLNALLDNAMTSDDLSSVASDLEESSNHSTKETVCETRIVVSL